MYCLLMRVTVKCKTELWTWEPMNLEESQYEIYVLLENKRNQNTDSY